MLGVGGSRGGLQCVPPCPRLLCNASSAPHVLVSVVDVTLIVLRVAKDFRGARSVVVTLSVSIIVRCLGWHAGELLDE